MYIILGLMAVSVSVIKPVNFSFLPLPLSASHLSASTSPPSAFPYSASPLLLLAPSL